MPFFSPVIRRDAWINYTTRAPIEAPDAQTACEIAERAWKERPAPGDPRGIKFEEDGLSEFDEILCDPDDAEEVDPEGNPIELVPPLEGGS